MTHLDVSADDIERAIAGARARPGAGGCARRLTVRAQLTVAMPARRVSAHVLVVVDEPGVPELAHGLDDRQERRALRGQLVLDPRRRLGIALPPDDALALEHVEPFRERPRADAGARPLELGEAARALGQVVHDHRRPFRADDVGRTGDGALCVVNRSHRAHGRMVAASAAGVGGLPPRRAIESSPGRRVVHPAPRDHRRDDARPREARRAGHVERVAVEHDEIGELAGHEASPAPLVAGEPRPG